MGVHPGASLAPKQNPTRIRYRIVLMLFIASCFSYGDRVMLSITGIAFSKDLHLDALKLGYLLSGFSWAYVVGQLPAGGLLDRNEFMEQASCAGRCAQFWRVLPAFYRRPPRSS